MRERFWNLMRDSVGDTANHNAPAVPRTPPTPVITRTTTTCYGLEVSYDEHLAAPNFGDLRPGYARIDASPAGEEDAFVAGCVAQRVKPLLIAPYIYTREPRTVDEQAALVGAIAARYAREVWGIELLNEPNLPAGSNGGSRAYTPAEYALYAAAMAKAIRTAAPAIKIVLGGPSGIDMPWYRALAALGVARDVDLIGFHPYGSTPANVVARIAALASLFPGKSLMCTEHPDVAMHEAMDGYVDASIIFTLRGTPKEFALIGDDGTHAAGYDRAKALLNRDAATKAAL